LRSLLRQLAIYETVGINFIYKNLYNLDKLSSEYTDLINENVEYLFQGNHIFIYHKIFDFRISYLSPAYHFNTLKKVTDEYFEKDIPKLSSKGVVDENDMSFLTIKIQLELNALLISIKTALDRLVFFISKINKSVSPSTTFGRIKENGKGTGLMSEVLKKKEEIEIMELIYQNYYEWISDAVKPRDTVVHYENLSLNFKLLENNNFEPVFSKWEKGIQNLELNDLKTYVDNWMKFSNEFLRTYCITI